MSFDWSFQPSLVNPANAVTFFNGSFTTLSSGDPFGSFSQLFSIAGTFGVGFYQQPTAPAGNSFLSLNNAQYTPAAAVPTPALLPGLIGLGLGAIRKRKKAA